jgi:hypothetical protein
MGNPRKNGKQSTSSPDNVPNSNIANSPTSPGLTSTNVIATPTKATHNPLKSFWTKRLRYIGYRLSASLIVIGPIIPIVVSLITVVIYLSLPSSILPLHTLFPLYTLLISFVITGILWFLASISIFTLCTAKNANPRNFGLVQNRLHQLKAKLYLKVDDCAAHQEIQSLNPLLEPVSNEMKGHQQEVVKEAYTSCCDIEQLIYGSPSGLRWILGYGYNTAWRILHHAEEAMVEVKKVEAVVHGAKHDFMSIQGSQINGKDGLLDDIIHSVKVLKPEALIYFQENLSHKSSFGRLQIIQSANKPGASTPTPHATDKKPSDQRDQQKAHARITLREVKGTINDYRDKRWEGLVRQRSQLLKTIAVTGLVTFIFLTVMILGFPFINTSSAFRTDQKDLLAATIIYMVGALAGLFVRFYAESQNETSIDDFGLSTTRLIAIPLLSGLAAIGGVVITELLGSIENNLGISDLFNLQQPKVLFTAAIFGAAPNLFIRGLQKQASNYEAEIQSSKASENVK